MQFGRLDPIIEGVLMEQEDTSLHVSTVQGGAVAAVRTKVLPGRHMASRQGRDRAVVDYDGPTQDQQ
jgi:hypothetical protein